MWSLRLLLPVVDVPDRPRSFLQRVHLRKVEPELHKGGTRAIGSPWYTHWFTDFTVHVYNWFILVSLDNTFELQNLVLVLVVLVPAVKFWDRISDPIQ